MNLPHLQQNKPRLPMKQTLGMQSLRALSRSRAVRRSGRQTGGDAVFDFGLNQTLPLPDPSASWRTLETQRKHLLNLPYSRLAQIALDLSPEVNKGMFDFLRFANPSHILQNLNERAKSATDKFIRLLDTYYGSFKSHIDSLWAGIFITGGAFPELVLDDTARMPVDLVFNDPMTARFRREPHPIRGNRWRLGQETRTGFKYLDTEPLVRYLGFDKLVDNPYGRPIIGPSVHSSIFLLGLIQDLRRVIANQGLSRIDYALDIEELLRLIDRNPDIAGDDQATAQFIEDQIDNIQSVLGNLEPDQDYVHASTVQVNYSTSPVTINMNGLNTVIENLQRNVVNGFKGVSALANVLDSTTETHIRAQLEYFVAALQSLQDEVADMFVMFFDAANQVQGIPGETTFMFRRQRTADKKATAEIEKIRT
ncbi:MAG: hypothetical protein OXM61_16690, partial [Candidatus Poribacteria bacterium]|nr:hypothetical protein [Candidatus Poribacteria bacterium]